MLAIDTFVHICNVVGLLAVTIKKYSRSYTKCIAQLDDLSVENFTNVDVYNS